jgi:hypothetical protein
MITIAVYRHNLPTRHKIITQYQHVEATRILSDVGALQVTLDEDQGAGIPLQPDTRLVVIISAETFSHIFGAYLLGSWTWQTVGRMRTLILKGLSYNVLLTRRIVAYPAGSAQASKSGAADDVMRAVVRENLGELAGAGRDITAYGLTVEPDLSLSSTISMSFAWRNVYDVVTDIARLASQQGQNLLWDVIPVDDGYRMQFIVRRDFYRDRRQSSPHALWLSAGNAIENIVETYDRRESWNVVYAGGRGEEADRTIITVTNSDDIARSVLARTERFFDGATYSSTGTLTAAAYRRLREGSPVTTIRAQLLDDVVQYGRDIIVGDAVTIKGNAEYDMILRTARLVARDDTYQVNLTLEQV